MATSPPTRQKILLPLEPGVRGSAVFSECGNYRRLLTRYWGDDEDAPFALWIGMNPSMADAAADDPTTQRECRMTRSWGGRRPTSKPTSWTTGQPIPMTCSRPGWC